MAFISFLIGTPSNNTSDQSSCPSEVIQENIEVEGEVVHHEGVTVDEIKTD